MLLDGTKRSRSKDKARVSKNAKQNGKVLMAYNVIKEHMEKYLEGQIAKHTINAQVFMKNPVGVAEHPDTMATIEEELGKIAEYKDKLAALNGIGYAYHEDELYKDRWQKTEW